VSDSIVYILCFILHFSFKMSFGSTVYDQVLITFAPLRTYCTDLHHKKVKQP